MKTGHLCIPRPKPTSSPAASKARRFTPVSLLERFREAVFRLIMISALSSSSAPSRGSPEPDPASAQSLRPQSYYYDYNSSTHHSEAVADCIEFIKKKACPGDELEVEERNQEECNSDDYSISSSPTFVIDALGELDVVMPVPVM